MTTAMRTKLLFKTGFAPVQHLHARKYKNAVDGAPGASCPFCPCADETAAHFALRCPQFAKWCTAMQAALHEHVGDPAFPEWDALPDDAKLAALLDDHQWGSKATGVDHIAQRYLSDIVRERETRLQTSHCTHPAGAAGASGAAIQQTLASSCCNELTAMLWIAHTGSKM